MIADYVECVPHCGRPGGHTIHRRNQRSSSLLTSLRRPQHDAKLEELEHFTFKVVRTKAVYEGIMSWMPMSSIMCIQNTGTLYGTITI